MANINDVAKKAGVGVSTVSKVLNNYDNISQETKDKVIAAVDELNYVPNLVASALSSKKGKRLAVVIFINNQHQAIDEINMQYMFGAFEQCKQHQLEPITVFSNSFIGMNKKELVQYFKSMSISGMVVFGLHKDEETFMQMIEEEHFPIVLVDVPIKNKRTSYVMIDHQQAQYDITKQVINDQKSIIHKILYLAGNRNGFVTDLRLQGIVDICAELEINLDIQYADFSEKKAISLVKEYGFDSDIIVCASDLMAIGAINGLKEMDIFRPVCGFDGIKLLGYTRYHIKTVKQDFYKIAERTIDEVKRLMLDEIGRELILDYTIARINYGDVIL